MARRFAFGTSKNNTTIIAVVVLVVVWWFFLRGNSSSFGANQPASFKFTCNAYTYEPPPPSPTKSDPKNQQSPEDITRNAVQNSNNPQYFYFDIIDTSPKVNGGHSEYNKYLSSQQGYKQGDPPIISTLVYNPPRFKYPFTFYLFPVGRGQGFKITINNPKNKPVNFVHTTNYTPGPTYKLIGDNNKIIHFFTVNGVMSNKNGYQYKNEIVGVNITVS